MVAVPNLAQTCTYQFAPKTLCGLGTCDAPLICTLWTPALYFGGPLVGIVAGLAAGLAVRKAARG